MDKLALVIADGEHPLCKPFGGQAVHPELEAEKAAVGIHNKGADVVQHNNAAAGHEHITGKADKERMLAPQIGRQHRHVIKIFDRLERYQLDIFQFRQMNLAAIVAVGDAHVQAGALNELVQPHYCLVDIAGDAGDIIAQDSAVDDNGVQICSSFSQWEQSSSSCCQSAMRRVQYSLISRSNRSSLKARLCSRISSFL